MALVVPPPNDKKRVKVYELKNNDWFDRGTGFCTGRVVNVSASMCFEEGPDRALLGETHGYGYGYGLRMADTKFSRKSQRYTSSRRICRSVCYWKQRLRKMMDIRSSKVTRLCNACWY